MQRKNLALSVEIKPMTDVLLFTKAIEISNKKAINN